MIFLFIYLIFIILYFIKGNNEIIKNVKVLKKITNINKIKEFKNEKNDVKFRSSLIKNNKRKNSKKSNNSFRKKIIHL